MAVFSYQGRNQSGKAVNGAVDAASLDSAAQKLLSGGISPISIDPKKVEANEEGISFSFGRKVQTEELIILTRQ